MVRKFLDELCNFMGLRGFQQKVKDILNVLDRRVSRENKTSGHRAQMKREGLQ